MKKGQYIIIEKDAKLNADGSIPIVTFTAYNTKAHATRELMRHKLQAFCKVINVNQMNDVPKECA